MSDELMLPLSDRDLEYVARIMLLVLERDMTPRAAKIVVDAAMYGRGCVEGQVRAKIESNKNIQKEDA